MAKNFLKYSSLTYDDIIQQINDRLAADARFDNFRESSIAKTIIEIFAGTTDLINFYVERRAEECFFDTLKLKSSAILLARSLGYDVQRAVPASGKIKLKLKGDFTGVFSEANEIVQIPYHSVFSFEGQNFLLKKTLTFNVNSSMQNDMIAQGTAYESDYISVDYNNDEIFIVQGEIKEKIIDGTSNAQVGSKFQIYRIEDPTVANTYGNEDYDTPTTKIWVGNTKNESTEYQIDRRSLINWETISLIQEGVQNYVSVLRTAVTEGVEILFGDAKFAALGASVSGTGAQTSFDNIYFQYLSTNGLKGNKSGIKDKKINFSDKIYSTVNGIDITSKVQFWFNSNLTGGADMESIDEIKANAPGIYYSLDRLVTKEDYRNFLKSLTNPINIKNALAWGEQEEIIKKRTDAIVALFNVVFWTAVGSLYNTDVSPYSVKTGSDDMQTTVLDYDYNENEIVDQSYYNVYARQEVVRQLQTYETSGYVKRIISQNAIIDQLTYWSLYQPNMEVAFNYTSDNSLYDPNIITSATVLIDVSDLNGNTYATNDLAMTKITERLISALRVINDTRGNVGTNANNGSLAFENINVIYNSTNATFEIIRDLTDKCYITELTGLASSTMGLSGIEAINAYVTEEVKLSENIITVLNKLNNRSQVTVKNIYVSPIIKTFELKGTVIIQALYDREEERTKINDSIYEWLDIRSDFNQEIYISNLTELIEQYPSVKYANIRLVPQIVNGGPFYVTGENSTINSLFTAGFLRNSVYSYLDSMINNYIGEANTYDVSGSTEKNINYNSTIIQEYAYKWYPHITERSFFEDFVKSVYDGIIGLGLNSLANSIQFNNVMSDIRKDFLNIIGYNMLDTMGNIAPEYNANNEYIKGGYSLGNEIVKIDSKLVFQYATN